MLQSRGESNLGLQVEASFLNAITEDDSDKVRALLSNHREQLTRIKFKSGSGGNTIMRYSYPLEVERDAFTMLGAYIGPITGLQLAVLLGRDVVAKDILDSTFDQDVDAEFGNGNTALQLAVLLGAAGIVSALMERGADEKHKNGKGYMAVDMSDDPDILALLQ